MNTEKDKELIGKFKDGAQLFRVIDRSGIVSYTIEVNGEEYYSVEWRQGEPDGLIRFYERTENTKLMGAQVENEH